MELGNFSMSIAVKDIKTSKEFYENLGFTFFAGDFSQNWIILKNEDCTLDIFQGMFEKNILTFNPGWDKSVSPLKSFTDIRELKREITSKGITILKDNIKETSGPWSSVIEDPDGNTILLDQYI